MMTKTMMVMVMMISERRPGENDLFSSSAIVAFFCQDFFERFRNFEDTTEKNSQDIKSNF